MDPASLWKTCHWYFLVFTAEIHLVNSMEGKQDWD